MLALVRLLALTLLGCALMAADPDILTLSPDTGSSASDNITKATTLTLTGTADAGSTVEILFDGTNPPSTIAGSVLADGTGAWTITFSAGAISSWSERYARARATLLTDTRLSTVRRLVIDPVAIAPTITGVSPQGQTGFTTDNTPTISGSADPGATVSVFSDGGLLGTCTADATTGAWTFSPTATMPDGTFAITALQDDLAGNGPGPLSTPLSITVDTFNSGLTVLRSVTGLTNNPLPTFQGLGEIGATISLRRDTAAGPVLASVVNAADPWVLTPATALADGDYTVYVVSRDRAGNQIVSSSYQFTVDTIPPQNLAIVQFDSAAGAVLPGGTTDDRTLLVSGTINTLDAGAKIAISIDGIGVGKAVAGADGRWTCTLPSLRDATYTVTASATDAAGNSITTTAAQVTISVPSDTLAQRFTPAFTRAIGGVNSWTTSNTLPNLTGTAGPLRQVTLTAPQTGWPTTAQVVRADNQNRWSWTPPSALPDGTYTVTATSSDGGSTPFTLIIDTQPPSGVTFQAISTDSGSSATDQITNDKTLVIGVNGITDPTPSGGGLTVTAFIAGVSVGSGTVTGGAATIDLTGITLTEGSHRFTFQAKDGAGNTGPLSPATTVIVDQRTQAPLVQAIETDTGRSTSDRITKSSINTAIRGRSEPGATVSVILNGGGTPFTAVTNGSGTWSAVVGALTDGSYTIQATTTDAAGNTATAAGGSFTVDNTPPVTPTVVAITEDRGASSSDFITADNTLVVSGTAENDSDVTVTLSKGGITHTRTTRSTGSYSADFTAVTLADGIWTLTVTATDAAGNANSTSTLVTIDTVLTVPTLTAITDDTGRSATDFRTQDTSLTITGTASTEVDVVSTILRIDGVDYPVSGPSWSQVLPLLSADATYPITLTTRDLAGNVRTAAPQNLIIDNTVPTAAITAVSVDTGVSASDFITNDTTLFIDGTSNEADPDVLVRIIRVSDSSVLFSTTVRATGTTSGTWTADATGVTLNGNPRTDYLIEATPTDAAGNVGNLVNQALIIDTVAPVGAANITAMDVDSGSSNTDNITNDVNPNFSGTYTGAGTNDYIRVLIDGAQRGTVAIAAGNGTWSWTFAGGNLDPGAHATTVQVMDDAGNLSTLSAPWNFTVDTTTTATTISLTPDTGNTTHATDSLSDKVTKQPNFALSGTAEAFAAIVVKIPAAGTVTVSTTANGSGSWSITGVDISALADGSLASTAQATDIAGNVATANFTIVLDRVAPAVPVITGISSDTGRVNNDRVTNDRTLIINGTAEAHAYVDVSRAGTLLGFAQANASGKWSFHASADTLPAGTYTTTYTAVAADLADNISAATAPFSVFIDTEKPPTKPVIDAITTDSNIGGDFITNDNRLIFTGTANAGGTALNGANPDIQLRLAINGTNLPWVTPNGTGAWTVDHTATALADGAYTLTAYSQDLAGNNSTAATAVRLVVDTTAPNIAISSVTDDTGTSASDFITRTFPITISGTVEALSAITLTITKQGGGFSQVVTGTGMQTGQWNLDVSTLPWTEGVYDLVATAVDLAGNPSAAPATRVLTIDTTAPTAPVISSFSVDSGTVGDFITNDNTPTITGTGEIGALIRLNVDGTERGTATVDGAGNWTITVPALADGNHAFIATATDVAGNVSGNSNTLTLRIDTVTTNPVLLAITIDSGTSANDLLTNDATLILTGRAEAGALVTVTVDGQVRVVSTDGSGGWTADFTAHALVSATYPATLSATDIAGNTGTGSSSLVVDLIAPLAPTIDSIERDTGAVANDFVTNDNSLILRGKAEANSSLVVFVDGQPSYQTTTSASGDWTWDARALTIPDGTYQLTAQATDRAGNVGPLSTLRTLVVDTVSPLTVEFISFTTDTGVIGDLITADRTLVLTGVSEPGAAITVKRDGTTILSTTTAANGRFTVDLTGTSLADGTYQFTADATDRAGNKATSQPFPITIDGTAPAAPVLTAITVDSATAGDWITNDRTLLFSGTAEALSTVRLRLDGSEVASVVCGANGQWVCDLTAVSLPDGTYAVSATATDAAGNISAPAANRTLVIDQTAPLAPTLAVSPDTGDSATDSLTNASPAGMRGAGEPGARLVVTVDGQALATTTVGSNGQWSVSLPTLTTDGIYQVTAKQTDAAGNISPISATVTMTIDRTLSVPVLRKITDDTNISTDRVTSDSTPTLSGTADPLTRVVLVVNNADITTVTASASGKWSITTPHPWADGTYQIRLRGEDPAGNRSGPGTAATLVIDTTPPATPVISGITDDTGVSATDFITNDQNLIIFGTAEAGATVELAIAGIPLGSAVADSTGAWSIDATAYTLPPGLYELTAHAIDIAGNQGADASQYLLIDTTTDIDVQILVVAPDTGVRGDRITKADVSDNLRLIGLSEPGATITVKTAGGSTLGTTTADVFGLWSFTLPALVEGTFSFVATSVDLAGNPGGPSGTFTITIDRTTAIPTIDAVVNDTAIATDFITYDNTVTVVGTAEAGATVHLQVDGVEAGSATADSTGAWTKAISEVLADGPYVLIAHAEDIAGNTADSTGQTLTIDTTLDIPEITSISLDSNIAGDFVTNDQDPTFTGLTEANAKVLLFVDDDLKETMTADGSGAWTSAQIALADGVHQAVILAIDVAGNFQISWFTPVTIDSVMLPPVIVSWTPDTGTQGDGITGTGGVTISGTAEPDSTLVLSEGGATLATVQVGPTGNWSYAFTTAPLEDGLHSIIATATDLAGNSASSSATSFTVDTIPPDKPVIDRAQDQNGQTVAEGTGTTDPRPTVYGSAEANAKVVVLVNGIEVGSVTADAAGTWVWFPGANILPGKAVITATATDAAGNRSAPSEPYTIVIIAEERRIEVEGCGAGSFFALILLGLGWARLRPAGGGQWRLGSSLLLVLALFLPLAGVEPPSRAGEPGYVTPYGAEGLGDPLTVVPNGVHWEWGVRVLTMPQPEEVLRQRDGVGDVPPGDWHVTPLFGAFLRRSDDLGIGDLRWSAEGGLAAFQLTGTSREAPQSDAIYDYRILNLPLSARLRLEQPLGSNWRIGIAGIYTTGPAVAQVSGTATSAGVTTAIGADLGAGLYTSYGVATDLVWLLNDAQTWSLSAELGYIRGRTSLEHADQYLQGGQVVASDTYTTRIDLTGLTYGLGLLHRW